MSAARPGGRTPLCPSAQPDWDGAMVLGIVNGTVEDPRVVFLAEPQPPTDDLLALTRPVNPTEVLRIAAPCKADGCAHFDGRDCRLVAKTVALLPAVVEQLPPCRIRPRCRWWLQEGRAACRRCPAVVTENVRPSEAQRTAADPSA
ncbi:MAG: nitrogen fixation protein [Acidimicrobiales bacterium]